MSKFVRNIIVELDFEGDKAVFTLSPMTYATALRFRESARNVTEETKAEAEKILLSELAASTQFVRGITDAAGVEVEKEVLFNAAYFAPLVADLALEWMRQSTPSGNG